jgi:hypothetical protein
MEDKSTNWRMGGSINANNAIVHIRGYMDVAKTLGVSKMAIKEDEYYASNYNSDPIKLAFLNVYAWSTKASAEPFTMNMTVTLTYYATLFGRNTPNTS